MCWLDFLSFNAINILAGRGEPLPEERRVRQKIRRIE